MTNELIVPPGIEQRLEAANTVGELKAIRDVCEVLRRHAKSARLGLVRANEATTYKLLAERKAGALLLAVPRAQGKDGEGLRVMLARSGIAEPTARRWMVLVNVS